MIVFITRMPESADVTRKVMIRTTHMMVRPDQQPALDHLTQRDEKLGGV